MIRFKRITKVSQLESCNVVDLFNKHWERAAIRQMMRNDDEKVKIFTFLDKLFGAKGEWSVLGNMFQNVTELNKYCLVKAGNLTPESEPSSTSNVASEIPEAVTTSEQNETLVAQEPKKGFFGVLFSK